MWEKDRDREGKEKKKMLGQRRINSEKGRQKKGEKS